MTANKKAEEIVNGTPINGGTSDGCIVIHKTEFHSALMEMASETIDAVAVEEIEGAPATETPYDRGHNTAVTEAKVKSNAWMV